MSFRIPANHIFRRTTVGMEGMHCKMFDPPQRGPATPELLDLTNLPVVNIPGFGPFQIRPNTVPEVMAAAGFLVKADGTGKPSTPHTVQRDLMHGMVVRPWDNQRMMFFLFRDADAVDNGLDPVNPGDPAFNPKTGSFPGAVIRVPRGSIYHCQTSGHGPPPHTIHWHGQEPTTMNDGVGHCSMEIGGYTYQWQPNFIGSYFYHCHRNTMQHFEFGLYGFTIIDPPDAFHSSIASVNPDGTVNLNNVPLGNCRPEPGFALGSRRTAANLDPAINPAFARFGQTAAERVPVDSIDPTGEFPTDPHAYTVRYDVEALWVSDDRDFRWSNLAPDARATFPKQGDIPGVNDNFHGNAGGSVGNGFFAFNDFRSTHWYITGINVPGPVNGTVAIPPNLKVPPGMISGVGAQVGAPGVADPTRQVQVSISALRGQNILLRFLNAAYNNVRVTFPVDIVIIAWDGRALGVPPFTAYNAPVQVPAGTAMTFSVARRFDAMINVPTTSPAVNGVASVDFIDTLRSNRRFTAQIPIVIA
jgi:FtsP/CotA-like multicopper oxidase with cupredoxin domain